MFFHPRTVAVPGFADSPLVHTVMNRLSPVIAMMGNCVRGRLALSSAMSITKQTGRMQQRAVREDAAMNVPNATLVNARACRIRRAIATQDALGHVSIATKTEQLLQRIQEIASIAVRGEQNARASISVLSIAALFLTRIFEIGRAHV